MRSRLFIAVLSTLFILGCLSGCAKNEESSDINGSIINTTTGSQSQTGTTQLDSNTGQHSDETEITYAPTEEILDEKFCSLKVQFNNDVFQLGGYITVAELVEEYSDRYTITYKEGSYEERKDYLLEYNLLPNKRYCLWDEEYSLELIPKYGDLRYGLTAFIANITSPDEKVTLDQAYVLYFTEKSPKPGKVSLDYYTPLWISGGIWACFEFGVSNKRESFMAEHELICSNENVMLGDFEDYLETQGFTPQGDVNYSSSTPVYLSTYNMQYRKSEDYDIYDVYVAGGANASGFSPLFTYRFIFDGDTDKLDIVNIEFNGFFSE